VSVVATVLNEGRSIDRLLASLAAQTRLADEVVIVDGGSTDGTLERLRAWAAGRTSATVLSRPGANISAGRNAAIAVARGPVIACTDAGVVLADDWLAMLCAPFASGARAVSGFFVADPVGPFETALGATTLPLVDEVDPETFLPSSRSVAFLKEAWAAAGGYPEWLDYCEDLVFDFRLVAAGGRPAFAAGAVVAFRPRPSLGAFVRQYYRYARGDGKADLWPLRHALRYGAYGFAASLGLAAVAADRPLWLGLLAAGFLLTLRRPYRRLLRQWRALGPAGRLAALAWVPVIRVAGDLAKMAGYPVGLAWRWRHRPPAWRPADSVGRL
jgi:glycosyltransferase involved in cell wall biosynthesis